MRIFLKLLIVSQFFLLPFALAQSDNRTNQKIQELNPLTRSEILNYKTKFDTTNFISPLGMPRNYYSNQFLNSFYDPLSSGYSWFSVNPIPQGNELRGVFMSNKDNIFAAGLAGTIISTTNGGINWRVNYGICDQEAFAAITFINPRKGFAISWAGGSLLETTDGGISWNIKGPQEIFDAYSIDFVNERIGFIGADQGKIYSTSDGGDNWNLHYTGDYFYLTAISFSDSLRGIAGSFNGNIYKTLNGGITWELMISLVNYPVIADIYMKDSLNAYAISNGQHSAFLKSTDGGNTWQNLTPLILGSPHKFAFPTDNSIVIVEGTLFAGGNNIIKSIDSGNTFYQCYDNPNGAILSVFFSDSSNGVAVGKRGVILYTSDGGESWDHLDNDKLENMNSIYFVNRETGLAVGENGTMLKTTDGGANWEKKYTGTQSTLNDLIFMNQNIGYAVGSGGIFVKTSNCGETWYENQIYSGVLKGLYFKDAYTGFAVGQPSSDGASILYTSDSGVIWNPIEVEGGLKSYNDIFFVNDNFGSIASGLNGTDPHGCILITTDSGVNWSKRGSIDFPPEYSIRSTFFVDTLTGYAVGGKNFIGFPTDGMILKTTDGGYSWYNKYQSTNLGWFNKVKFMDHNNGIAVGGLADEFAFIFRTTDGGENWFGENTPTRQEIKDIDFIENLNTEGMLIGYTLYTVGAAGTILVSAISPLNSKIWTWTGVEDSSWNNANNWNPSGVPLPGDSVIIPYSQQHPVIYQTQQQIVIGSLDIQTGGWLTITDSLKQFVVLGDVKINGTLELRDSAKTNIIVIGGWIINQNKYNKNRSIFKSLSQNFIPGKSTVDFLGQGEIVDGFYNLIVDTSSVMNSVDNLLIERKLTIIGNLSLGVTDTLFIESNQPQSLIGPGKIVGGTIKRSLLNSSTENYQFESENTFLKFDGTGTYPEFVSITTYPDTTPTSFGTEWIEVPSTVDPINNVVTADSITEFSRWSIRIPRRTGNYEMVPDSFVHRVYEINAEGGSDYKARLSLRYDQSEVPAGVIEDSLRLFKLNETTNIKDEEEIIPNIMALYQNYPNPFNSSTKIRYEIPERGRVSLVLYDVLGCEVKRLVNLELEAGQYEADFNGNDLSSGVYFYKLSLNSNSLNHSLTKKFILLK